MSRDREQKLSSILEIAKAMSVERELDQLLGLVIQEAKSVLDADRCSIFVLDAERAQLWSRVAHGLRSQEIRLPLGEGIAGWVAQHDTVLNLPDAYDDPRFQQSFDLSTGYRTRSILCAPMRGAKAEVVGVIQALNRNDAQPFDAEDEELLLALGGQAAVSIQNALLHEDIERLFEGFVKASVVAIEARDPTTSGHSERVATLTCALAATIDRCEHGPFASFHVSPTALRELRYAALLHDFGKVGVREHVLVKAMKLYPWQREQLALRFELARVAAQRDHFAAIARGEPRPLGELEEKLAQLDGYWSTIERSNQPTVLSASGFDGLRAMRSCTIQGCRQQFELITAEELELLSIPKGSLSASERAEIESHVSHTFRFLSMIPWTQDLRSVPELAHAHHEKLGGQGYPLGLKASQIPIGSRMMAIADIYDALTASDRPYKAALECAKALAILDSEARRGLVDSELLTVFIEAKVFEGVEKG
ncbi:MAG: GAF domain-containing protein [Myxococcota bacterium]|nr:GAF domain-containing protein [Myxococcota bacterium]